MQDDQKEIANNIVAYFKEKNGNRIERQKLIEAMQSDSYTPHNIGYVIYALIEKNILINVGGVNVDKYVLHPDAWNYTNYDDLLIKEKLAKEIKDKKDNIDLKNAERVYKTYPVTQIAAWVGAISGLAVLLLRLGELIGWLPLKK